jgi:hypothetical protein
MITGAGRETAKPGRLYVLYDLVRVEAADRHRLAYVPEPFASNQISGRGLADTDV